MDGLRSEIEVHGLMKQQQNKILDLTELYEKAKLENIKLGRFVDQGIS